MYVYVTLCNNYILAKDTYTCIHRHTHAHTHTHLSLSLYIYMYT